MKKYLIVFTIIFIAFLSFNLKAYALETKSDFFTNATVAAANCSTFFKNNDGSYNRTYFLLENVFKIMKYAAVCLVLGFSVYDFVKAIASNDDAAIKKAISNSVKRLIIGALVFFLPYIVKFVLGIIGDFTTCDII